jgi:copper chaperone NosL
MTITDTRFGGELITDKGKIFKFDDIRCMAAYLDNNRETKFSHTLVIDFESPNTFLEAGKASYVTSPELKSPMGSQTAAFKSKEAAASFSKGKQATVTDWAGILKQMK